MKTLITPAQAVALAFGDGEYLPPQAVAEADIAAAEERFIVPVIGRALYEKMLAGDYSDFVRDYLAAPAALFTRLAIQPRLDIRTLRAGSVAPRSDGTQPAAESSLQSLRRSLRTEGRALLRRASDYLETHRDAFPEYDPRDNILNRCTTHGNLVQMR